MANDGVAALKQLAQAIDSEADRLSDLLNLHLRGKFTGTDKTDLAEMIDEAFKLRSTCWGNPRVRQSRPAARRRESPRRRDENGQWRQEPYRSVYVEFGGSAVGAIKT